MVGECTDYSSFLYKKTVFETGIRRRWNSLENSIALRVSPIIGTKAPAEPPQPFE
jgi:hypothetical protein